MIDKILNYAFLGFWQFFGITLIITIICNTLIIISEHLFDLIGVLVKGQSPTIINNWSKDGKKEN